MNKILRLSLMSLVFAMVLTSNLLAMSNSNEQGTIRGSVYLDVDGDGRCVETGVAGELPVPNIDLTFAILESGSSVSLYSGSNGTYGLPSVGQGDWVVTAVPNPAFWQVTSTNPRFVKVAPADGLVQLNVDFCVTPAPGVSVTSAMLGTPPEAASPQTTDTVAPTNSMASEQLLTAPPEARPAENLEDHASEEVAAPSDETWLSYLNQFRAMGGMEPFESAAELSNGAQLHTRYMVLNDAPIAHSENANNPLYTPEGHLAAQNSNIFATTQLEADYKWAINFWISAPFHLVNILDPTLETVGYGDFHGDNGTFKMAAALDVLTEKGNATNSITYPLLFPAPDSSTWIVRQSLFEWPDPITSCPGYERPTGAPIVMQFGDGSGAPNVSSYSVVVDGKTVESCLLTETNYTNPDRFAQDTGRIVLGDQDAIVILPRNPLLANSTYTVNAVVDGESYSWSFSTVNDPPSN